jgi:hypothetical protein
LVDCGDVRESALLKTFNCGVKQVNLSCLSVSN